MADPLAAPDFVVKIMSAGRFMGTGILLTPRLVLTCRHCCFDTQKEAEDARATVPYPYPEPLQIVTADRNHPPVTFVARADDRRLDLALLELASPFPLTDAPLLLSDFGTEQWEERLKPLPWWALGYVGEDKGRVFRKARLASTSLPAFPGGHDTVDDQQIPGGLKRGLSGGPVAVRTDASIGGGWIIIGQLRLGRDEAALSRFRASSALLEFLTRYAPREVEALRLPFANAKFTDQRVYHTCPGYLLKDRPILPRTKLQTAIKARLLDSEARGSGPVVLSRGLHGAGGYGKTTLALLVAHDPDVLEFFRDGVLWAGINQAHTARQCFEELFRPVGLDEASRKRLKQSRFLCVVDNVWREGQLGEVEQLLKQAPNCRLLVTTRIPQLAGDSQEQVDELEPQEARELFTGWVGGKLTDPKEAEICERILVRVGRWPLQIELIGAAIGNALKGKEPRQRIGIWERNDGKLESLGVSAFYSVKPDEPRHQSINACLDYSIEAAAEIIRKPLEQVRGRVCQLGLFARGAEVPISAVAAIWGVGEIQAEDWVEKLRSFSLVKRYGESDSLKLHDEIQAYFEKEVTDPLSGHQRLLAAWSDLRQLPSGYAWEQVGFHLMQADQGERLRACLLDYAWLRGKLWASSLADVLADCERLASDLTIQLLEEAFELSAYALNRERSLLAGQLYGRLHDSDSPELKKLAHSIEALEPDRWWKPLVSSLSRPGKSTRRRLPLQPVKQLVEVRVGKKVQCIVILTQKGELGRMDADESIQWLGSVADDPITCTIPTPDAMTLLTGHSNGSVHRWALDGSGRQPLGEPVRYASARRLIGYMAEAILARFRGDENGSKHRRTLGCSEREALLVWVKIPIEQLLLTPDGTAIVSVHNDGSVHRWALDGSGRQPLSERVRGDIKQLVLTPGCTVLLTGHSDGCVHRWALDGSGYQPLGEPVGSEIKQLVLTPDGTALLSGHSDSSVHRWALEGSRRRALYWHEIGVRELVTTDENIALLDTAEGRMKSV